MIAEKALLRKSTETKAACCIYVACRKEGAARSFKEICSACNVPSRAISMAYKLFRHWKTEPTKFAEAADFVSRFCASLVLDRPVQMLATKIASNARKLEGGESCSPVNVAAAAVYYASKQKGISKPITDFCSAFGLTSVTLYRYARQFKAQEKKLLGQEEETDDSD